MTRAIGIDPGTVSFDVCGLEDGQVFLDTTVPSKDIAANPQVLVDLLESAGPVDAIVGPSGYGLPLVHIRDVGERELFLQILVDPAGRERISVLGGLRRLVLMMKERGLPVYFVPGVIHLPTVPAYRKANKLDMGTADKMCCAVLGVYDQARHLGIDFDETSFIFVEVGGAYTAIMAVDRGKIVDGLGGTTGSLGYYSLGAMDGELAYLLGNFPKETLFSGGASFIAGRPDLAPEALAELVTSDGPCQAAWQALVEGVVKSVAAETAVVEQPREILLSGRLCRIAAFRQALAERLERFAPVRRVAGFASVAKEAAQGAALIADGLTGGQHYRLFETMEIGGACGTVFDYLYIRDAEALKHKYLLANSQ